MNDGMTTIMPDTMPGTVNSNSMASDCMMSGMMGGMTACAPTMGQMQLAVADAPVDGAEAVVVEFTGAALIPESGPAVNITFPRPKTIDLLNQSGTAAAILFTQAIASGTYTQIRLQVAADGDPSQSYITLSDGTEHGLLIQGGPHSGLKLLSGSAVTVGGAAAYTVDFDLRKSVTCPAGQSPVCLLQPAVRLVDDSTVGTLDGSVSNTLVPDGCTPGVYLYSGNVSTPEDMNGAAAPGDGDQPLGSRVPVATSMPPYSFRFPLLPPGTYSLAFTCQASLDDPSRPDRGMTFHPIKTGISVRAGGTTTVAF